ncbi:hypothetical protein B0J13DRAFT_680595 [Dactylonectria estremocensis]|uniref:Uncharacterized protein n=1 Tax=Dactylonectria estremocensis TaxID=1079267 RepID=A0A9P9DJU4_9HYPO|nr:hypothetical protein B0J13DRAFT_680595 [Dactylonectria estremocensis]
MAVPEMRVTMESPRTDKKSSEQSSEPDLLETSVSDHTKECIKLFKQITGQELDAEPNESMPVANRFGVFKLWVDFTGAMIEAESSDSLETRLAFDRTTLILIKLTLSGLARQLKDYADQWRSAGEVVGCLDSYQRSLDYLRVELKHPKPALNTTTWFRTSAFTMMPDKNHAAGPVVGMVASYANSLTHGLAWLSEDHPEITLPATKTECKTVFIENPTISPLASGKGNIEIKEITFESNLTQDALAAIAEIERVKYHVTAFTPTRPFYIVTGLRMTNEAGTSTSETAPAQQQPTRDGVKIWYRDGQTQTCDDKSEQSNPATVLAYQVLEVSVKVPAIDATSTLDSHHSKLSISIPKYQDNGPTKARAEINVQELAQKTVIITGGANGLGKANAKAFADAGAFVVIADFDETAGRATEEELSPNVKFAKCDIRNWDQQLTVFDAALAESPNKSIDIVIANAGIVSGDDLNKTTDPLEAPVKPDLRILQTNLIGTTYMTQLALHFFRRQPLDSSRDRCFIITGSVAAYVDQPGIPQYSMSKWGARGLFRNLRRSASKEGIRVNFVAPWYVRTPILPGPIVERFESNGIKFAALEDCAKAMLHIATEKQMNGHAFGIVPREEASEGYIDLQHDDYEDGDFMKE